MEKILAKVLCILRVTTLLFHAEFLQLHSVTEASCHVSWKLTNYCSRLDDVLISGEVALLRNEHILVTMTRDEKNVIIYRKFYRSIYRGGIVGKFGLINSLSGCVRANFEDCCAQITMSSRIYERLSLFAKENRFFVSPTPFVLFFNPDI